MKSFDMPEWCRKYIYWIRGGSLTLGLFIMNMAYLFPAFCVADALGAIVGLFILYILTLTVSPAPDWDSLDEAVKKWKDNNIAISNEKMVVHTYFCESYYDLWKWDMLLEKNDSASMAVLTSPSTENKTVGYLVELIKENEEFFLRRYARLKRYDGKYQLCVVQWTQEDSRMKEYLKKVDLPSYVEIYGDHS